MKRTMLVFAAGLFLSVTIAAQTRHIKKHSPPARTHRATRVAAGPELERLSSEIARAYANHDVATLDRIESADYQTTMTDGKVVSKADDLALERDYASKKAPDSKDLEVTNKDVKVRLFGIGAAVTGRSVIAIPGHERSAVFTHIFEKRRGRWVLVASQWTNVGPPADGNQAAGTGVTTPSGLKYVDLVVGTGVSPSPGKNVTVNYLGALDNGKKFDSSYDHGGPFTFQIGMGHVIKGWDEGVITMKVGGKRLLIIPPELGYGARGAGGGVIPPNASLIFEVELLSVQ